MISSREDLAPIVRQLQSLGHKVGFTSGVFDILTAGHVDYLAKARAICDYLIVGVNSDLSASGQKENRPIIAEDQRIAVIAGLKSVDAAFLFDDRRNRTNLEILRPDFYIKGGVYSKDQLTSSDVVESYGGEVKLIPVEHSVSTTQIVNHILATQTLSTSKKTQKAVLVDRDGTINEEVEYLHEPEKFVLTPGAGEGLRMFQDMGYKIVVVTMQGGIGLGYYAKEDLYRVNREMFRQLKPHGVIINKIYFDTQVTKGINPKVALVQRAERELDLDLSQCIVIGDKSADLNAGPQCIKIAVETGHGLRDQEYFDTVNFMAENLLDAAKWIKERNGET